MQPTPASLRAAMIDSQLRPTGVNDPRILEAFMPLPREAFVPAHLRPLAYLDAALEIAPGRFLMEPMLFGNLVLRADPMPGDRVLLVGAASGYEAAILGRLAGEVTALEVDPALAARARSALAEVGVANVRVVEGPHAAGWAAGAPYSLLFLNGSVDEMPATLAEQLAADGRFVGVMPDFGSMRAIIGTKAGGAIGWSGFMDISAAALPDFERPRGFTF